MTNEPVQKKVNLTVNGVADVQGNRGPQWEIQIQYYFSKFPTKQWVDNDGTNDKPAVGQTYPCIIQRGELSSDRDGKVYDGSAEWMYRWRIVEFNTGGEPWSNPAGPQDYEDAKRDAAPQGATPKPLFEEPPWDGNYGVERRLVFNRAVDLTLACMNTPPAILTVEDNIPLVESFANALWPVLQGIGSDPTQGASGQPESDVAPASGTSGLGWPNEDGEKDLMLDPPTPNQGPVDPNEGEQPPDDYEERE